MVLLAEEEKLAKTGKEAIISLFNSYTLFSSCGLAEQLEDTSKPVIKTPTSSCGNVRYSVGIKRT